MFSIPQGPRDPRRPQGFTRFAKPCGRISGTARLDGGLGVVSPNRTVETEEADSTPPEKGRRQMFLRTFTPRLAAAFAGSLAFLAPIGLNLATADEGEDEGASTMARQTIA